MRKQFTEKFAEIQHEFDKAFKDLFGGGKGTLELVEDEDILECGIRIIAQPPGKKLQNMMQLSGGEKSLTAIALLFAIPESETVSVLSLGQDRGGARRFKRRPFCAVSA